LTRCPRKTLLWTTSLLLVARAYGAEAADAGPIPEAGTAAEASDSQPSDLGLSAADSATTAPDWVPKLRAQVRPASGHLGDPIRVTLVLTHRKGVSVTLPLQLQLGDFSELSRKEKVTTTGPKRSEGSGSSPSGSSQSRSSPSGKLDGERIEHTYTLRVAAYKLGELTLPPIEITALGPGGELYTMHTEPIPIRIGSVMPNEPNPKLKGMEPPVRVFQRTWWLLYALGGLALVLVAVVVTLVIQRRLQRRAAIAAPPPPPTPPHVVALLRLDGLEVEQMIEAERFKELYLELSEIVREYIGGRWQFDALEMTTAEIAAALAARSVSPEVQQRLQRYFNDCDLVKFAKFQPDTETAQHAVNEARAIVKDTMVHTQPQVHTQHGQIPAVSGQPT